MEISEQDMLLDGRAGRKLAEAYGVVFPYEEYDLPNLLTRPLVVSEKGSIPAYRSGERSSIVHADKRWFKKKGDHPRQFEKWESGEPFGGMSKSRALNELESSKKVHEKLIGFGYNGPMFPAALVEYDVQFTETEKVYSAILEIFGDTRVSSVSARLIKANKLGMLVDQRYREQLMKGLLSWLGFSHRVIRDTRRFPIEVSYGLNNCVLYDVGCGYGVGRIDLNSASEDNLSAFKKMHASDMWELLTSYMPFPVLPKIAKKLNKPVGKLLRQYENGGLTIEPLIVDIVDKAVGECLHKFESIYYNFFDNDEIPKPIDRLLIHRLFDAIRIPPIKDDLLTRMNDLSNMLTKSHSPHPGLILT